MNNPSRKSIRKEMKVIISNLDERWVKSASKKLCLHLSEFLEEKYKNKIKKILTWTRFFPGEVDLSWFIGDCLGSYEIYLPRASEDFSMTFISIAEDWLENIEAGYLGIPEPTQQSGNIYETSESDDTLVIVPGLAFSKNGNRLGRGKGYYDRFLGKSELKGCVKIGVCWQIQILPHVPTYSHDVDMDYVCHEQGFLKA